MDLRGLPLRGGREGSEGARGRERKGQGKGEEGKGEGRGKLALILQFDHCPHLHTGPSHTGAGTSVWCMC